MVIIIAITALMQSAFLSERNIVTANSTASRIFGRKRTFFLLSFWKKKLPGMSSGSVLYVPDDFNIY